MWPEKDILMWESAVNSYEEVLRRRKLKVKPSTRSERLQILRQCYRFYTEDYGPPDKMQLERLVFESCQAIYEERKGVIQQAVEKTKALLALADFCELCHLHNVGFRLCGRCKAVKYCSEKCQKEDWKKKQGGHKEVCNAVQRGELKPENVPRLKVMTMVPTHAANALIPAYVMTPKFVYKA
ncbi:hypothetical protein KFL_002910140 [Klebsormidium nitens]|uniref:MYND-type domain-containing protein n=1 Tax=Klebsormidium nitens TaxID=105231 RepID=A0A1Y1ICN5_KLENI|nr:hypothetical protein KFL_002910140 [Klebsormidium nitens]|eukprot:GAQ86476.1 hypothetical protein KFL_002910140 [Klebsormidium nitens]